MSDEQEAVTQVEETTETESAPVETNTVEPQETPVVESNDTEDKDSKTVPYERFKEVNDKLKDLEDKVAPLFNQPAQPQYQPTPEEIPELDPDAARAVDYRVDQKARQIVEANETAKFNAKHGKDFEKDPLLQAAYMVEVNKIMSSGQYVDREAALESAKEALEARLKPAQVAAKQEGVKEGQDIAKTKQQLGAVGETGKVPDRTDEQLSAAELAAKYNIPRLN